MLSREVGVRFVFAHLHYHNVDYVLKPANVLCVVMSGSVILGCRRFWQVWKEEELFAGVLVTCGYRSFYRSRKGFSRICVRLARCSNVSSPDERATIRSARWGFRVEVGIQRHNVFEMDLLTVSC